MIICFFFSFSGSKGDLIVVGNGDYDDDDDLDIDDSDSVMDEYSYHFTIPTVPSMVYDSDGRFICECGKTYKEERYLRYHKKWECNKLPTFQCPYCDYCAKRKSSLKQHLERKHSDAPKSIK